MLIIEPVGQGFRGLSDLPGRSCGFDRGSATSEDRADFFAPAFRPSTHQEGRGHLNLVFRSPSATISSPAALGCGPVCRTERFGYRSRGDQRGGYMASSGRPSIKAAPVGHPGWGRTTSKNRGRTRPSGCRATGPNYGGLLFHGTQRMQRPFDQLPPPVSPPGKRSKPLPEVLPRKWSLGLRGCAHDRGITSPFRRRAPLRRTAGPRGRWLARLWNGPVAQVPRFRPSRRGRRPARACVSLSSQSEKLGPRRSALHPALHGA
jgi:hypothetical protein